MDHSRHIPLTSQDLNEAVLVNAPVYGADDHKVGTISHVHGAGAQTQIVVDVGGFLGLGAKPVLIGADQINLMRDENGDVHGTTSWTKKQLEDMPEHKH